MDNTGNLNDIRRSNSSAEKLNQDRESVHEPIRDDSYEEDYDEDFDENAGKAAENTPGSFRSPSYKKSLKPKSKLINNMSRSSLNPKSKGKKKASSMIRNKSQKQISSNTLYHKSKPRNGYDVNNLRGSVNQRTETKFPAMRHNKLYQSVSDKKARTQFSTKFAFRTGKKPAMTQIEENIEHAKHRIELVNKRRQKLEQCEDEDDKLILLSDESKILKNELKTLNNSLNLFLEEMRIIKLRQKSKKNIDPGEAEEHKRILKQKEIENYDKMTRNLVKEYNKLSKRLDLVSNPQYIFDLREKVEEMKTYVKSLKNDKKQMEKHQANRDKKLNYMMNKGGEIGHLKKINNAQNELAVTKTQLLKLNQRFEKMNDTKKSNQEYIAELTQKLDKLQASAEKYNIDVDKVAEEVEQKQNYEDFVKDRKALMEKKSIMEKAIKVQKAKYQQLFKVEKKRYEDIVNEKQEIHILLQQREEEAKKKNEQISELKIKFEKYKTENLNNYMKNESDKIHGSQGSR